MERLPLPVDTGARLDGVDAVLDGFFSVAKRRAASLGSEYVELWTVLERSTAGGKHFRPRLVLAVYEALGGADHRAASRVGAAFELLHAALLVHDDVIDRDFFRRGIPNVSGSYRDSATTAGIPTPIAEHRGRSAAIIAGDLALAGASRLFDALECQDGVRARLRDIFDEAIFESAGGEMLDVELSLSEEMPTVENILRVGRAKTAVYSFEAPLQSGAVLAHASDAVVRALGDFGRELGVAYQVVDDLLGVFGSEHLTGKSTLSDLREGKRTVLVAHAATTNAWFSIKPFIGKSDLNEREAEHVRGRLEICGARAFAEGLVQEHARRARAVLDRPMIDTALRDAVNPMIDAVLDRAR
ncbi:polyprenyl synthetase family protein [Glaciihabitans sp. UYNi722]|uniref:polyprenyl synthetase family protein n=1 Tax=Glaciihabitans sp. UYNi722 TaxID=3156344 RepID=UPI003394D19D